MTKGLQDVFGAASLPAGQSLVLVCPGCNAVLLREHEQLQCRDCGKTWPVLHGVPHLIQDHPYCGEIPQLQMAAVLKRAAAGSWKEALTDSSEVSVQRVAETTLNLDRANWYRLTDLGPESRVLDLGAGLGTISHALARRFSEVIALEPVLEAVEFMRHRFSQERLENVICVRSSVWEMPFQRGSFDLVVMNGVLEWVAAGKEGDPERLQQEALDRVSSLIRPGGYLYLGVDNRFWWRSLLGTPDANCGLPYVAILPRPLAAWYARRRGHEDGYRSYTYSAGGYRRMLARSGFAESECYAAIPGYNSPNFYVSLNDNVFSYFSANFDPVRSGLSASAVHWLCGELGVSQYLQNSFVILARKA